MDDYEISDHISYLTENVSLFNGSVKDNIVMNRDYTDNDYERVKKEKNY